MNYKEIIKKSLWIVLVIFVSFLMIQEGKTASAHIRIDIESTFQYCVSLLWEILNGIAVLLPVWLLSLLGLARSFLGENWFPFAEKIPMRVTKIIMVISVILLIGVTVAGTFYSEYSDAPYYVQYAMENRLERLQTVSAWALFYSILLYVEQWCIQRNYGRQKIRKKQKWVTVIIFLTWLILLELSCVNLWYIPLRSVDCPNNLEDYYLWWFSLYLAVFFSLPWFFAVRKTVRLFKNNAQWLTLSSVIPKKFTVLVALLVSGVLVWEIREWRFDSAFFSKCDLPEYADAVALEHLFRTMIWGLIVIYMFCLLVKQIRSSQKMHRVS